MSQSLKCNIDDVVLWIVGNPQKRRPLRLDPVTELERGHLYLCALADKCFRHPIEVAAPLRFLELHYLDLQIDPAAVARSSLNCDIPGSLECADASQFSSKFLRE